LHQATLEFWVRFPNERNQGKQAHPVLKYRVPHGSHPAHSFIIGPAVINTHSLVPSVTVVLFRFSDRWERGEGRLAKPGAGLIQPLCRRDGHGRPG